MSNEIKIAHEARNNHGPIGEISERLRVVPSTELKNSNTMQNLGSCETKSKWTSGQARLLMVNITMRCRQTRMRSAS